MLNSVWIGKSFICLCFTWQFAGWARSWSRRGRRTCGSWCQCTPPRTPHTSPCPDHKISSIKWYCILCVVPIVQYVQELLNHFNYVVSYYIKLVKTLWTYSMTYVYVYILYCALITLIINCLHKTKPELYCGFPKCPKFSSNLYGICLSIPQIYT